MGIMKRNSGNFEMEAKPPYKIISGKNVLSARLEAEAMDIKWHHAAGHSSGRERIAFYPKNKQEKEAIDRLELTVFSNEAKSKEAAKNAGLPRRSKAALWGYLEENGHEDKGLGGLPWKNGRYGKFVPKFGEPDGIYYFDCKEIRDVADGLFSKERGMSR